MQKKCELPKTVLKNIKNFLTENKEILSQLSEFMIINTTDNGKKHIIFFKKASDKSREFHLFKLSYKYCDKFAVPPEEEKDNDIKVINDFCYYDLIDCSIYGKATNCDNIFIIHKIYGWQQVFNSYIYRYNSLNVKTLKTYEIGDGNFCFELVKKSDYDESMRNIDQLSMDYMDIIKNINVLPHIFTLPLFAYIIFSYTKSLFRQYTGKVGISQADNYFALNIIPIQNVNINKYILNFVKGFSSFPSDKKVVLRSNPLGLVTINTDKITQRDFTDFVCNSEIQDFEFQTKVSDSKFDKSITSKISYIYFNLKDHEKYLLNLFVPENIELPELTENIEIEVKFPYTIFNNFIDFISKQLSYEAAVKEKKRKNTLLKKLEYLKSNKKHFCYKIYLFLYDILYILEDKNIFPSECFFYILENEIKKFTIIEFTALEKQYRDEDCDEISEFAQKYYDKHIFHYEPEFEDEKYDICKIEYNHTFEGDNPFIIDNSEKECEKIIIQRIDYINDMMYERYTELLVNSFISISKHHPTYFDDLYIKAKRYLKDNLKGKRYDKVQASRCAFLWASMMSFKDYIDDCLSEVSDDFNKYFQIFNNSILQMCCISINENIDNTTALSEFTEFLTLQIDNGSIIDRKLGNDSKFGWIDRKVNKIFLKNTRDNNFYGEFINYLKDRHMPYELSKQDFVRNVLDKKGILNARFAGGVKRYDCERKIVEGHDKFRVLVLDCERLNIQ